MIKTQKTMANPDFSTFRPLDLSTLLPPFVLSSFCLFVLLSFCPFVVPSFRHFVLLSFCPFVLLSFCHSILPSSRPSLSTSSLRLLLLIPLLMIAIGVRPASAQVMHLEIRVDPEFGLAEFNAPDLTAQASPGEGLVETAYDQENAGQLTLHTREVVDLKVTMTAPDVLVLDQDNQIPLDLWMAYAYVPNPGPSDINILEENSVVIRTHPGKMLVDHMISPPPRFESFLYFFGNVVVGDVSEGIYEGTVRLRVEYP